MTWIVKAENAIQNCSILSNWIEAKVIVYSFDIEIPGNCNWKFQNGQLSLSCLHLPTLKYWSAQILNSYGFNGIAILENLNADFNSCQLINPNRLEEYLVFDVVSYF